MACRRRKPATRRRRPRDRPMQSASLLRRRRFSGASHDPNLRNRRQAGRARSGRPHAIRLRVGRTCWNARLRAGFRLFRPPATCSTAGNAGNGKRNASPTTRITRTRWRREWRSSRDDHEVDPAGRPSPGQTSGHVNARIRGGSVEAPPPAAMRQTAAEQLLPRRALGPAARVAPSSNATPKAALRSCWRIFRRSTQDASRRRIHRLPRVAGGGASWRAREDSNPQPPDP